MSTFERPTTLSSYNVRTLAVIWTMQVVSGPLVAFRVYWRIKERKGRSAHSWIWADICMVLTWTLQLVVQILNVLEILDTLQQYQSKGWQYMGVYAGFVATAVFMFLRLSVVLFLIEIFPGKWSKFFGILGTMMVMVSVAITWFWFGPCFAQNYGKPLMDIYVTYCRKVNNITIIYSAPTGLVFDLGAVILPLFPILRLRMTLQKKLYVLSIFALGWLTVAATLVRCVLAFKIIAGEVVPGLGDNLTTFVAVEIHVGLIAMSLITSWKVIKRKLFASQEGAPIELVDHDFGDKDSNDKSPARSTDVSVLQDTVKNSTTYSSTMSSRSPATTVTLSVTNTYSDIGRTRLEEC